MGFLKNLFGGGQKKSAVDDRGIYLYFRSRRAPDAVSKVRIDKQYDLNQAHDGFVWHKTIVDSKYFSRIEAVVHFDRSYNVTSHDLRGGELIDEAAFEAAMATISEASSHPQ